MQIQLGPQVFVFTSFQEWVNKAQSWFASRIPEPARSRRRYLAIDAVGRVCMIGADFMRARDEETFPVAVYLIDSSDGVIVPPVVQPCGCATCTPRDYTKPETVRMILCAICGNKRCPHATDHRLRCTNSNEPGQWGSAYGVQGNAPAQPPEETVERDPCDPTLLGRKIGYYPDGEPFGYITEQERADALASRGVAMLDGGQQR